MSDASTGQTLVGRAGGLGSYVLARSTAGALSESTRPRVGAVEMHGEVEGSVGGGQPVGFARAAPRAAGLPWCYSPAEFVKDGAEVLGVSEESTRCRGALPERSRTIRRGTLRSGGLEAPGSRTVHRDVASRWPASARWLGRGDRRVEDSAGNILAGPNCVVAGPLDQVGFRHRRSQAGVTPQRAAASRSSAILRFVSGAAGLTRALR